MNAAARKLWKEGWEGTSALTSQCFGLQVAGCALMSDDTSEHAQYTRNSTVEVQQSSAGLGNQPKSCIGHLILSLNR